MFGMNGKETNKFAYETAEKDWQSAYFKLKNGPMVVYVKVKRKSVRYLEVNHEDYNMEKFHEKLIDSLKNKANRLNYIVDDMKRKLN